MTKERSTQRRRGGEVDRSGRGSGELGKHGLQAERVCRGDAGGDDGADERCGAASGNIDHDDLITIGAAGELDSGIFGFVEDFGGGDGGGIAG